MQRRSFLRLYRVRSLAYYQRLNLSNTPLNKLSAGIIITLHFGPYRLLPRELLMSGHAVTLIASKKVIDREAAWYYAEMERCGIPKERFSCIKAEDKMVLRKLIHHVKEQQRLVIVFIDANEGVHAAEKTALQIQLFAQSFFLRENIGALAYRFSITIYLLSMTQSADHDWTASLFSQVDFKNYSFWGEARRVLETEIDNLFKKIVYPRWYCWENWSLLNLNSSHLRYAVPSRLQDPILATIIEVKGRKYILDLSNHQYFDIT